MEDNTYNVEIKTEIESLEFVKGGEKFSMSVHIKNNSTRDLFDTQLFYLSYHVLSTNGEIVQWDNGRFLIQLVKGASRTITVENVAPEKKGDYVFQFDIVKEGVEWYSAKGMQCPFLTVKVLYDGSVLFQQLEEEIRIQKMEEAQWKERLESGNYDFFHPYCKLDPYGRSPLSAILLFDSDDEMAVEVNVPGISEKACIHAEFPEYVSRHTIPIYGLYPNKTNHVEIKGKYRNGRMVANYVDITTEEPAESFRNVKLITYIKDEELCASGLNFCYTGLECKGRKMAYDIHGDIRWYFTESYSEPANYLSSSSVWLSKQTSKFEREALIYEYNLCGRIQSVYFSPYGVHHDIQITSKNTMLVPGNSKDVRHDILAEIDLETGEFIYVQDYKDIFQRTRNVSVVYSNIDWLHMNAVVEYKGDLIVSGNTQSTILRHDRNGQIKWMLCDPTDYGTYWKQFILQPVGSEFEYPYNQHAMEVLPDTDGNPDTVDILMFDNGYSRNKANHWEDEGHPLYSRMVQYQINEKEMTVRQVWEYGKERPELFSMWRGDADQLENGNRIGVFNVRQKNEIDQENYMEHCVVVEVDQEKNVVWECYGCSAIERNSYQNYRIERKEIYDKHEKNIDLNQEVKVRLPGMDKEVQT